MSYAVYLNTHVKHVLSLVEPFVETLQAFVHGRLSNLSLTLTHSGSKHAFKSASRLHATFTSVSNVINIKIITIIIITIIAIINIHLSICSQCLFCEFLWVNSHCTSFPHHKNTAAFSSYFVGYQCDIRTGIRSQTPAIYNNTFFFTQKNKLKFEPSNNC